MKKVFFYISFGLVLTACSSPYDELNKIDWLEGRWIADAEGNQMQESWSKENDSTWIGKSSFIKEGKTLYTETMSIRMRQGKLKFIAAVTNQNNAQEIFFDAIQQSDQKIVFENKLHDFPNQITYEFQGKDKLLAYISGELNGEKKRIDFKFNKVN